MPFYEHVFIARQELSPQQVEDLAGQFSQIIADNGGSVTKTEQWGLRNLAYKIRKNRKGHYVLLNVDSPAAAMLELERVMRINDDVIRLMTIRVDELEEGPSAMMVAKSSRDDRGPRGDRGDRGDRGSRFRRGPESESSESNNSESGDSKEKSASDSSSDEGESE